MRRTGSHPYADRAHRGLLRYGAGGRRAAQRTRAGRAGRERRCPARRWLRWPPTLERASAPRLHSLWWNGNPARTNVILGPLLASLDGSGGGLRGRGRRAGVLPARGVRAGEPAAVRASGRRRSPAGCRTARACVEFHAGCGAIGLGLLPRVARLAFNEVAPAGLEGLALGLAARPTAERARAEVLPGPAADHADAVRDADVVIVDPPRRGLDDALLAGAAATHPPRATDRRQLQPGRVPARGAYAARSAGGCASTPSSPTRSSRTPRTSRPSPASRAA